MLQRERSRSDVTQAHAKTCTQTCVTHRHTHKHAHTYAQHTAHANVSHSATDQRGKEGMQVELKATCGGLDAVSAAQAERSCSTEWNDGN